MYFPYGETEMAYLKNRDPRLGEVIDRVGLVERPMMEDLFACIVQKIVGQQISSEAQRTVFARMEERAGQMTPQTLSHMTVEELQQCGTSFRKAGYIKDFTRMVTEGELKLEELRQLPDEKVIARLVRIKGIGHWTAEMTLISCLGRKDVLSFGDLGIQKGLRMLWQREEIDEGFFEEVRQLYSPYGTIAGFYIWAVAAGAMEGWQDPGATVKKGGKGK